MEARELIGEFIDFVTSASNWNGETGIAQRTVEHIRVSGVALMVAALLALPGGVLLARLRRGAFLVQSVVNIGRAVPSLAILALLFPLSLRWGFGLGFWPTFAALVVLAVPPMFTNAYTAIRSVDGSVVEASRGMGMRPLEVLSRVEIPSGLGLIMTGIRIAALQVIATATLGAYVGLNGLGSFINEGFRQRDDAKLLTGALAVALCALAVDLFFGLLVRRAMPWAPKSPVSSKGIESS